MIYQSALVVAAAVLLVALLTGRNIVRRRVLTLNGRRYELTLYSNETIEVYREDGLKFVLDMRSGSQTLVTGTPTQLEDALRQLKHNALSELGAVA